MKQHCFPVQKRQQMLFAVGQMGIVLVYSMYSMEIVEVFKNISKLMPNQSPIGLC